GSSKSSATPRRARGGGCPDATRQLPSHPPKIEDSLERPLYSCPLKGLALIPGVGLTSAAPGWEWDLTRKQSEMTGPGHGRSIRIGLVLATLLTAFSCMASPSSPARPRAR